MHSNVNILDLNKLRKGVIDLLDDKKIIELIDKFNNLLKGGENDFFGYPEPKKRFLKTAKIVLDNFAED